MTGGFVPNRDRLRQALTQVPGGEAIHGDLARAEDRAGLADTIRCRFGRLAVLVNNAGVQRRVSIASDCADWAERQTEIDLLLSAPVQLADLVMPLLREDRAGHVVNVTSGGAFTAQPFAPMYSAAKATLHSYTMNLRYTLADTGVAVSEPVPPAVATGLAGPGQAHGADVDEFCDSVFPRLEKREPVVGFGPTDTADFRDRLHAEHERFLAGAQRFPTARF